MTDTQTQTDAFTPTLFINIRKPDVRIARTRKHPNPELAKRGARVTDGTCIRFQNTQFLATTKEDYDIVKKSQPWAFEEPHDDTLEFNEDPTTGFRTRNVKAYAAWFDSDRRKQIVAGLEAGED